MNLKKRILSILFWSIVTAAFIGPGTVLTATKAGFFYHFSLLWTVIFSTFACLMLQEASARITIHSQMNLGQAIAFQFKGRSSRVVVLSLVVLAIILGSAAYEAGNILGAIKGLVMVFDIPPIIFVGAIGVLAIVSLSLRSVEMIAKILGGVVFVMGIAFISTAIALKPDYTEVFKGGFIPSIPDAPGVGLIVLALIGTTVIPYDLFLGSGALDKKQSINDMRFGLSVAVILGGFITMSIMGVGNSITEGIDLSTRMDMKYSIDSLANSLEIIAGEYAIYVFGFGMFAAGFSSAITSPLASAITAKSLFESDKNRRKWDEDLPLFSLKRIFRSKYNSEEGNPKVSYFKLVSFGVLAVGLTFGFMEVKPAPAIIAAQAFNGLILPFISIFLIFVVNDSKLMGRENVNGFFSNLILSFVVWVSTVLGLSSIVNSMGEKVLGFTKAQLEGAIVPVMIISFVLIAAVMFKIYRSRSIEDRKVN